MKRMLALAVLSLTLFTGCTSSTHKVTSIGDVSEYKCFFDAPLRTYYEKGHITKSMYKDALHDARYQDIEFFREALPQKCFYENEDYKLSYTIRQGGSTHGLEISGNLKVKSHESDNAYMEEILNIHLLNEGYDSWQIKKTITFPINGEQKVAFQEKFDFTGSPNATSFSFGAPVEKDVAHTEQEREPRYLQVIEPDGCLVSEVSGTWDCDDVARESWLNENARLTQEEIEVFQPDPSGNADQNKIAYIFTKVYDCVATLKGPQESALSCTYPINSLLSSIYSRNGGTAPARGGDGKFEYNSKYMK